MAAGRAALRRAVERLSDVAGVIMDANYLVEDVFLLSYAFPDEREFEAAVASTERALRRIVAHSVTPSSLKYGFEGWSSFHCRHRVAQGARADCRIVFREREDGIEVKGFGHRRIPKDLYMRLSVGRKR